jgi:hypothetical protein
MCGGIRVHWLEKISPIHQLASRSTAKSTATHQSVAVSSAAGVRATGVSRFDGGLESITPSDRSSQPSFPDRYGVRNQI